jgi:hypothetical protein
LSIFGNPDFKDVADKIGEYIQFLPNKNLIGHLDESSLIKEDPNAIRIRGWIFDKETAKTPKKLFIVNENKEIIGYVLSGYLRNDVKALINKHAKNSGFLGYLFKNSMNKKIYLVDIENNKKLEVLMTGAK